MEHHITTGVERDGHRVGGHHTGLETGNRRERKGLNLEHPVGEVKRKLDPVVAVDVVKAALPGFGHCRGAAHRESIAVFFSRAAHVEMTACAQTDGVFVVRGRGGGVGLVHVGIDRGGSAASGAACRHQNKRS